MTYKHHGTPEGPIKPRRIGTDIKDKADQAPKFLFPLICITGVLIVLLATAGWLAGKAQTVQKELKAASQLLPRLKDEVARDDAEAAAGTVSELKSHTETARAASSDPLWTLAGALPWAGSNFRATAEISTVVDDVIRLGADPLVGVFRSLDWKKVMPSGEGVDLTSLKEAQPRIVSAAHAIRASSDRLDSIDRGGLLPQIAEPLAEAREQLTNLRVDIDAAAHVTTLAPEMLGMNGTKHYLLLMQNNAEIRATGGIPGALAVLTVESGKMSLTSQSSAGQLGSFAPPLTVDREQEAIYSSRIGKFMQDVNLTPDFPTAASTARQMWEKRTGEKVDGVLSIDPVGLSYVLDATGPVQLHEPENTLLSNGRLPSELTGTNVVSTLLSDVYKAIDNTAVQDAYFANVAKEVYGAFSSGTGDPARLVQGISRAADERRILLWSADPEIQKVISNYAMSGATSGQSVSAAQFGVYFNDGTGAKMDFYVKRTVQLLEECPRDGYSRMTVRVTSTNTAPVDAKSTLPDYVTGGGVFGVPEGTVQTNVIAYGPVQANVESAAVDGNKTDIAAHRHSNRPVGAVTMSLAPGQSKSVELTFGKIVQHTEPTVVVTPTIQSLKDVVLTMKPAVCPNAK
ncbi:DUF4012 domain-containing protein [Arthrobacter sp. ISL-72]|uniref:DUF4012 domain-containing protein n=1 Tax=Arthrobacter sp. ISL-72 TaxID=2819114 RepID=UPI001BE4FC50|nr:DUF4012 domain-containing protein [Arthrobacter sp. ISL-72]MBT2596617.1 DUF4012 domain-containing protein [Arthrobacter sp. ISL-72]